MALSASQKAQLAQLLGSTTPGALIEEIEATSTLALLKPQASALTITYSAGDPGIVANGAVTVANGATPTVNELLELIEEIIQLLKNAGIMAS